MHKAPQLARMPAAQREYRNKGACQRAEHIRLRIPFITLGAEKVIGVFTERQRHPPLNQLIKRADGERHAADQTRQHLRPEPVTAARQHFPRRHRDNEPLQNMPEAVIRVARKPKPLLHRKSGRTRA